MRRFLSFTVLCLCACGDPNAGRLYADIQYATRCEMTRGCDQPHDRDICGFDQSTPCFDGLPEAQISCGVVETEGVRTIAFSALQGGAFSIGIENAVFNVAGGSVSGANCRATVTEGENSYDGLCGGSPPSEAQPCQITGVNFYEDDGGNPTIEGDILCIGLENDSQPDLTIEVTAPGTDPARRNEPGHFRLANCVGLEIAD
jgi:hypothetical protein